MRYDPQGHMISDNIVPVCGIAEKQPISDYESSEAKTVVDRTINEVLEYHNHAVDVVTDTIKSSEETSSPETVTVLKTLYLNLFGHEYVE